MFSKKHRQPMSRSQRASSINVLGASTGNRNFLASSSAASASDSGSTFLDQSVLDTSGTNTNTHSSRGSRGSIPLPTLDELFGREKEVKALQEAYQRVSTSTPSHSKNDSSEVLLVRGGSGVGKSTLVQTALQTNSSNSNLNEACFYATGKFDQNESTNATNAIRPYGVISDVLTEICQQITCASMTVPDYSSFSDTPSDKGSAAKDDRAAWDPEDQRLLSQFIPGIRAILNRTKNRQDKEQEQEGGLPLQQQPSNDESNTATSAFALRRFAILLRTFLDQVASPQTPIVMVLDDYQWADSGSQQLIECLTKGKSSNILLVLIVRDEDEKPFLAPTVDGIPFSTLVVDNFSQDQVNELVAKIVKDGYHQQHSSLEKVKPLSEIIYQRTQGNVYFLLHFLELLHREQLLFNHGMGWDWASPLDIQDKTKVCDNVGALLAQQISQSLPKELHRVFIIAACLGFSFDSDTLLSALVLLDREDIWEGNGSTTPSTTCVEEKEETEITKQRDPPEGPIGCIGDDSDATQEHHVLLSKALDKAHELHLVERRTSNLGPHKYHFSHDRVQQTFLSMLTESPSTMTLLYRSLGKVILDSWYKSEASTVHPQKHDWRLFSSIIMLEKGRFWEKSDADAVEYARLCLSASSKATQRSAFASAASYADLGLQVLATMRDGEGSGGCWMNHYTLCLQLSDVSAEMHYSLGSFGRCAEVVDVVLRHGKTTQDKYRAMFIRTAQLSANRETQPQAISASISLLRELGCDIPASPSKLNVIGLLWKIKRLLKGRKAEALWGLPAMSDAYAMKAMETLATVSFTVYHTGQKELHYMIVLNMMYLTLKHGMCERSPVGITMYGGVIAQFGDMQGGFEFGLLALEMANKPGFRASIPATNLVAHCFLYHLKMPFQNSIKPTLRAYRICIELGEIHFAAAALRFYAYLCVVIGMPLQNLDEQMSYYCGWFKEYNRGSELTLVNPYLQLAKNLLGDSKDPLVLTGATMDEDRMREECIQRKDYHALISLRNARQVLCYLLGDFEAAERERNTLIKKDFNGTHIMKIFHSFFCGLTALAMARKTPSKTKYYQRQAKHSVATIQKYVKGGSVNGVPLLQLLNAERESLDRLGAKNESALSKYEQAAIMAGRCGFRLIKGIAFERTGIHLVACGDNEAAATHMQQAYSEFLDYGAVAKLAQMETEYPFIDFSGVMARQSKAFALQTFIPKQGVHVLQDEQRVG